MANEDMVKAYHDYLEKRREIAVREGRIIEKGKQEAEGQSLGKLLNEANKTLQAPEVKPKPKPKHKLMVYPEAQTRMEDWKKEDERKKRYRLRCDLCIHSKQSPCQYFSLAKKVCLNRTERGKLGRLEGRRRRRR